MEQKPEQQKTLTRLVLCAILAAALYAALNQFGERIPQLAPFRPWLAENKIQAIAVGAAVLFGASLLLFPLEAAEIPPPPSGEDGGPCAGYERTCEENAEF